MELQEKSLVITGSNRGIGKALAQAAAKRKMHLHLANRTESSELVTELKELGALSVKPWQLDMSIPSKIDQFVKDFLNQGNKCELLINNAGQLTGGLLENQETDKIYSMLQVNLGGLIHLTRAFLPHMLSLQEAKIVNNSSVSGVMFLPCASTYAASKAGVIAFTESLRNELEGTSVSTLALITPGVKTRMFDEIPDLYSKNLDLKLLNSIPASDWAEKVFSSIEADKDRCWPNGTSYFGVKLGQHFPGLLGRSVRPYFKR